MKKRPAVGAKVYYDDSPEVWAVKTYKMDPAFVSIYCKATNDWQTVHIKYLQPIED